MWCSVWILVGFSRVFCAFFVWGFLGFSVVFCIDFGRCFVCILVGFSRVFCFVCLFVCVLVY